MNTGERPRVLCVDDDPQLLRSLRWRLQRDHDVTLAGSGEQALQALLAEPYDVIISDQRMPGMTGTELLRHARSLAPHTTRVLLTGYADFTAVMSSVNDSEVFRLIYKPWDSERLLATVAEAVEASRAQRAAGVAAPDPASPAGDDDCPADSVLVFDRDPDAMGAVRRAAQGLMRVQTTHDIADALGLLSAGHAGVLVTDIALSGLPQLDLIRAVRRHRPALVVVVHSALRDSAVLGQLINEGQIFRYLSKPAEPEALRRIMAAALQRHRALAAQPDSEALHALMASDAALHAPHAAMLPTKTLSGTDADRRRGRRWLERLFG